MASLAEALMGAFGYQDPQSFGDALQGGQDGAPFVQGLNNFAQTVQGMRPSTNVEDQRPFADASRQGWGGMMGLGRAVGSADDNALSQGFRNTQPPTQREIDEYYAQFQKPADTNYRAPW